MDKYIKIFVQFEIFITTMCWSFMFDDTRIGAEEDATENSQHNKKHKVKF